MGKQKSSFQTAAGYVGIVCGSLGIISICLLMVGVGAGESGPLQVGSLASCLFASVSYIWAIVFAVMAGSKAFMFFLLFLVMAIPAMGVMAGVGLLNGSRWTRGLSLAFGITKITLDVLTLIVAIVLTAQAQYNSGGSGITMGDAMATGTAIVVLLVLFSFASPIIVMIAGASLPATPGKPRYNSSNRGVSAMPRFTDKPSSPRNTPAPPTEAFGIDTGRGTVTSVSKATEEIKPVGLAKRSARLVVVSGREMHREYIIVLQDFQGSPVRNVLGRDPDCEAIITGDSTIGRHHAEIREQNGHVVLHNLAATNPTYIRRGVDTEIEVVGQAYLRDGDRICCGGTQLQLHISTLG